MSSTDAVAGRSYRNGKPHAYGPQRTAVGVLLFSYLRPSVHVSVSELGGLGRPDPRGSTGAALTRTATGPRRASSQHLTDPLPDPDAVRRAVRLRYSSGGQ